MELLKGIRRFLGQFPSYIPAVVTDFGRANWMLWPQITAYSVLISHRRYLKTFLFLFMILIFSWPDCWLTNYF